MQHKPGLDLLRALAILWVIPFHSYLAGYMGGDVLRWSGWMGVDLFFALSGFLIGSQVFDTLAKGQAFDAVSFYLKRGFRTLPAYWVVLALYLCWPSLHEGAGMMPLWQFLTYSMNLLIDPSYSTFSHAWSLCVEEQFYLLFPALALLLVRYANWRWACAVIVGLVVAGMVLRGWLWFHFVEPVLSSGGSTQSVYLRYLYNPTYARLDDLLAGIALAAARSYHSRLWLWLERHANWVAAFGLLMLVLCIWGFDGRRVSFAANVFGYPLLAVAMTALVAAAASANSVFNKLRIPGVGWLAAASYSLYLTHKMVYRELHLRFAPWIEGHGIWTVAIYVLTILTAGALLYYLIERPCLQLRRPVLDWWSSRRLPPVATASS